MKRFAALLLAGSFFFSVMSFFVDFAGGFICCGCVSPVTKEQWEESVRLLARYSTEYREENLSRVHNIQLACERVSGAILPAGAEFSFNGRVGERTKENGFLEATVIVCGEYVLGIGGGVCQVSSTLFCAALLAGMEITESRAHSLAVGYIPPSLDAMVSVRSDLKFKNPRAMPVYFKARAEHGVVTAEVYGLPNGKHYETESVVLYQTLPPEDKVEEGECDEIVRESKCGIVSESFLCEYDEAGTLLSRTLIRKDSYAPIQGIRRKKTEQTAENDEKIDENEQKTVAFSKQISYNNLVTSGVPLPSRAELERMRAKFKTGMNA